jgi:diadenosine tetraphosphate (Ap4A) HIT family hydrolase
MASDGVEEGCAFCAIASGDDRTVEVVAEDTDWIAFFLSVRPRLGTP